MGVHITGLFVILMELTTLIHSSYYYNSTDNALVWRNSVEKLRKKWMNFVEHVFNQCIFRKSKFILQMYNGQMTKCVQKKLFLATHCEAQKPRIFHFGTYTEQHMCSLSNIYVLSGPVRNTVKEASTKRTRPIGQECIHVKYGSYQNVNIKFNNRKFKHDTIPDNVRYKFDINKDLGLNITFKVFFLSVMCVKEHLYYRPSWYTYNSLYYCFLHKNTEYLLIRQTRLKYDHTVLYYCLKRPQWSVYTGSSTSIEYFICKVCVTYKSTFVFNYQTLDSYVIQTTKDDYRMIFYRGTKSVLWMLYYSLNILKPFHASCIYVNFKCTRRVFIYYLRGEKWQEIEECLFII